MTKLLCTGDWQLGVQTVDLEDQEAVAHRIVDLAISENVDAVLHGGDVFEGPTITPEQLRAFRRPLARLRDAGIPMVVALGNGRHDQAMRDATGLDVFEDVPGISVYRQPGIHRLGDVSVAVLPWAHPGRLVAAENGGDRDEINTRAADLLIEVARGLRAGIDGPAVLLLHWSISGASLPSGLPVEMAREPILDAYALEELGFDAVIAAHVHKPQLLGSDAAELMLYVGSPQPLNHGEAGYEHGVWILDFDHVPSAAEPVFYRFHPVQSRPFVTIANNYAAWGGNPDFGTTTIPHNIEGAIVRFRYKASAEQARRIDHAQVRAALEDAGAHRVQIQPEIIREQRARVAGMDESIDDAEALGLWLLANGLSISDVIAERHARYAEQVGA